MGIKITDLPAAGALDGTELVELVQGGANVKAPLDELPISAAVAAALAAMPGLGSDNVWLGKQTFQGGIDIGSQLGFRNRLINGGMAVWQRGTTFALSTSAQYTADRWGAWRSSAIGSGGTVSRVAGSRSAYALRLQRTAGDTSANEFGLAQIVEYRDMAHLAGKTVTLSFWARAGANYSGSGLTSTIRTGTTQDQGGVATTSSWGGVVSASQVSAITTVSTKFTHTVTLGAGIKELAVVFTFEPAGTAGANDWFELESVQIEEGPVETEFEHRTYGTELAMCQRYYFRWTPGGVAGSECGSGYGYGTAQANIYIPFPHEMRIRPVSIEQSGTAADYRVLTPSSVKVCTSVPVFQSGTPYGARCGFIVASGITGGQGVMAGGATAAAYLGFPAEL